MKKHNEMKKEISEGKNVKTRKTVYQTTLYRKFTVQWKPLITGPVITGNR